MQTARDNSMANQNNVGTNPYLSFDRFDADSEIELHTGMLAWMQMQMPPQMPSQEWEPLNRLVLTNRPRPNQWLSDMYCNQMEPAIRHVFQAWVVHVFQGNWRVQGMSGSSYRTPMGRSIYLTRT